MIDKNWEARCLKARKNRDKLRRMIEYLSERDMEAHGGYPYDCEWIGRTLAIAALDEGKEFAATKLATYRRKELLRWFDRARRFHEKRKEIHGFEDSVALTAKLRKKITKKPVRKESKDIVKLNVA